MKATEILVQEHELIKQCLKIINIVCDKLESGEQVDSLHLKKIVAFIRNFADKYHHGKEEDILFAEMCKIGFSKESGPISVMLSEHSMGRRLVKDISEAAERYQKGDKNAISVIVENARKYSALLDQHINKENNVLYPMANARLSQEQQKIMLEEFDNFEQEKADSGKYEDFHKLLNELSVFYLS
jgi:hemerythrin-like domain-containing protein